jgi:hypothetical protein
MVTSAISVSELEIGAVQFKWFLNCCSVMFTVYRFLISIVFISFHFEMTYIYSKMTIIAHGNKCNHWKLHIGAIQF